jgi:hypothetical protein
MKIKLEALLLHLVTKDRTGQRGDDASNGKGQGDNGGNCHIWR